MGFRSPQGKAPSSISVLWGSQLRPGMSCLLSMAGWVGGSLAGMTDSSRMCRVEQASCVSRSQAVLGNEGWVDHVAGGLECHKEDSSSAQQT